MASGDFLVDDYDLDNLDVTLLNLPDWRAAPAREWPAASVATSPERPALTTEPVYGYRGVIVECYIEGSTIANLIANLDKLKARLDRTDDLELEFGDRSGKVFYARLARLDLGDRTGQEFGSAPSPRQELRLEFQARRPFLYDQATSQVGSIGSTATDIPIGTAPIKDFTLKIDGAFTDPTIEWRDSGGTVKKQTDFTLSKSAGEWIQLNGLTGGIVDDASANQQDARDSGTDWPVILDSRWGSYWSSAWPELRITSGTGTLTYRKAWL